MCKGNKTMIKSKFNEIVTDMRKYIDAPIGIRRSVAEAYNLSMVGVWKILNFRSDSKRAQEIRKYVLENGGKIVDGSFMPNCRNVHNPDGTLIQDFGFGISLLIDFKSGSIAECHDDRVVEVHHNVTIQSWGDLQMEAQGRAEQVAINIV